MKNLVFLNLATAILIFSILSPPAIADDWSREATAIFKQPVRIPGQVLPPGIYVFKLADLCAERNVVQIWNADRTELLATILGWPDYSREAPTENRFILEEGAKGAPAQLKAWFYRGNGHGQTFTYPKTLSAK
jgi:hypothetical protein